MENKRFCDLIVGEKLYIFYLNTYLIREILEIAKESNRVIIKVKYKDDYNSTFIIYEEEKDFIIYDYLSNNIHLAIATSMDRLLLECGDVNE